MRVGGISEKRLTQTPKKKLEKKSKNLLSIARSIDRCPTLFPLVFLRPDKNAASQTLSAFLPASNCIALLLLFLSSKEISSVVGLIFFL
jgi:hypothetical protein